VRKLEQTKKLNNKAIGQRMRREREKLDLSREKFAEIIGLSDYYVGQLERGERQMSLPVLVKIANCLHISLDFLIFDITNHHAYFAHDAQNSYHTSDTIKDPEINALLNKCSLQELGLIKKIIKTILPYLNNK
jgi:transcriptional regulator with XRE-family HTH domain